MIDKNMSEDCAVSCTKETPKIERKLIAIDNITAELNELSDILKNKLQTILVPEGLKEGSGESEDKKIESSLMSELENKINKLEIVKWKLKNIIDNVDL